VAEPTFHLVFRGEVLEGQHKAVVSKRLAALLKMAPEKAGALFSGKPVVLKRDAPKAVAAKYQAAFKKAGAKLRVVPVDGQGAAAAAPATPAAAPPKPAAAAEPAAPAAPPAPAKKMSLAERLAAEEAEKTAATASAPAAGGVAVAGDGRPAAATVPDDVPGADAFSLAPASGDLVSDDERPQVEAVVVDVSHLSAAPAESGSLEDVVEHLPPPPAPDVSGITLAEAGSDIGPEIDEVIVDVDIPDIDLAEAGAIIENLPAPPAPPVPDADFGVAELGADMDPEEKPPPPPAPDVSHISMTTERASFAAPD
jgi:hypothetical protein